MVEADPEKVSRDGFRRHRTRAADQGSTSGQGCYRTLVLNSSKRAMLSRRAQGVQEAVFQGGDHEDTDVRNKDGYIKGSAAVADE